MKKVCIITAARSEYGPLRWILEELKNEKDIHLQLVVTGGHLSPEQGLTYKLILDDGFTIDKKIEMQLSSSTSIGIAKSIGVCSLSLAEALYELSPDLLVVLGDRYELLPICNVALVMRIPIAHISGGDITEGAIDDQIRNAVTMMSVLHFPGTIASADRIRRMTGSDMNIYSVGEPGLDNFVRLKLMNRSELADSIGLDLNKSWFLLTQHPETKESLENNLLLARNIIEGLNRLSDIQVVITQANTDLGGVEINTYFREVAASNPNKYKMFSSLGQLRYLSLMKESHCIIGNSSSGIVEAPFLGKSVINIGKRQQGRHICSNVVTVTGYGMSIHEALNHIPKEDFFPNYYYGDGMTAQKIVFQIKKYLSI
jgi:UDP-N-acetylglucosamine 2-epimerase (non-hydrolysing)